MEEAMRRLTRPISMVVAMTLTSSVLTGCATRNAEAQAKLPIAESVCLQVDEVKEPEKGLLLRKAKAILAKQEFRVVDSDCDLKVGYVALDQGQWEMMTTSMFGLRTRSVYRVEGLVTVWRRNGEVVAQDMPINLRNYSSKADVLEALAWEFIAYVPYNYRPQ
jgi:hypothetical protein